METKTINDLVEQFAYASILHFDATLNGNYKIANKQAKKLDKIFQQIKKIGVEARKALLARSQNADKPVQLMIAVFSLRFDTDTALEILKSLSEDSGFVGFKARHAIQRWESQEWQIE